MILQERSYRLLVVSFSDAFNKTIGAYLRAYNYVDVSYATSANCAKKDFSDRPYDLVLINSPLNDESGTHLAIDITENSGCVTLLLTKSETFTEVSNRVFKSGVYVMAKPLNRMLLDVAFEWMFATRERLRKTEKNRYTVEEKMVEIRTVNHAKWILIEQFKISEAEAHRYIEKKAMDTGRRRIEIAEEIIQTYK